MAFGRSSRELDHLDHERLTRRRVEGVDEALERREHEHVPDGDRAGERERRPGAPTAASPATCVTTSTRCRFQRSTSTPANGATRNVGICPAKPTSAEQQRRAGQAIDEPAGGDARQPGADQRRALAGEEEAVVAMTKGPADRGQGRIFSRSQVPRLACRSRRSGKPSGPRSEACCPSRRRLSGCHGRTRSIVGAILEPNG